MTTTQLLPADFLMAQVRELRDRQVDALVPSQTIKAVVPENPDPRNVWSRLRLDATTPQGTLGIGLSESAHRQLAGRLNLRWDYYQRMLDEAPQLAATTLNTFSDLAPAVRLFRMMTPLPSEAPALEAQGVRYRARAVMSESYKVLDHLALLDTVVPEAQQWGAQVKRYTLTEEVMDVQFTGVERDLAPLIAAYHANSGVAYQPVREVVNFGLSIRNSETGNSSLAVEPWIEVLRCLNGMRVVERLRIAHLGKRRSLAIAGQGDVMDINFESADTARLDNATTFLKVRDKVREIGMRKTQDRIAEVIALGANAPLTVPPTTSVFTFVENVGAKLDLSTQEISVLQQEVVREQVVQNLTNTTLTPWSMAQGMTAAARVIGADGRASRRNELEELGWALLTDGAEELLALGATVPGRRRNGA